MSRIIQSMIFVVVASLAIQSSAYAVDEYNLSKGVTAAGVPLGLHGVDAVALTSLGAVAEGDATYTATHDGAAYYFASRESAERFSKNPEQYLPQYGGFCAYAVALGKKFDGDPMFADIVDGKLYLFVNDAIFRKYLANKEETLAKAERVWPTIRHEAVSDL
jgi:YHS domain-containing protein